MRSAGLEEGERGGERRERERTCITIAIEEERTTGTRRLIGSEKGRKRERDREREERERGEREEGDEGEMGDIEERERVDGDERDDERGEIEI